MFACVFLRKLTWWDKFVVAVNVEEQAEFVVAVNVEGNKGSVSTTMNVLLSRLDQSFKNGDAGTSSTRQTTANASSIGVKRRKGDEARTSSRSEKRARDVQRNRTYDRLPAAAAANSSTPNAESLVKKLIEHNPSSRSSKVMDQKLKNKVVMLENPTKGRGRRRTSRSSTRTLPRKTKTSFLDMGNDGTLPSFKECGLLHAMWKGHVTTVLGEEPNRRAAADRLSQIDLHGALLTVVRSEDPALVGQTGVVLREHSCTFDVMTPTNDLRRFVKRSSDFAAEIGSWHVTFKGNAMASRRTCRLSRNGRKRKDPPASSGL